MKYSPCRIASHCLSTRMTLTYESNPRLEIMKMHLDKMQCSVDIVVGGFTSQCHQLTDEVSLIKCFDQLRIFSPQLGLQKLRNIQSALPRKAKSAPSSKA